MGNCSSGCSASSLTGRAPIREATVLLLGIDGAGKTTLLANLNKESTEDISPTSGFSTTTLELGGCCLTVFDLGGGPRLRAIWKNYYAEAHGVVFVVDASCCGRLEEARAVLHAVLQDNRLAGKPLLVCANKQDREGAVGEEELRTRLQLEALQGEEGSEQPLHVVPCVAVRGEGGEGSSSPSAEIRRGMRWLLQTISHRLPQLSQRVGADVATQRAVEARERRERAERVRRIREERERQRLENGEPDLEEGGGAMENPFKPIQHAIVESAQRDAAAKAAKQRARERDPPPPPPPPPPPSHQEIAATLLPPPVVVASTAEGTANTSITGEERLAGTEGTRCVPASGSQSSLGSSTVLSASSGGASLTDVTPRSGGSDDSLQLLSGPAPSSQPGAPRREKPLRTSVGESRKNTRKSLLARLKNRNKTAPAPPVLQDNMTVTPPSTNEQGHPRAVSWAQGVQGSTGANEQGPPQRDTWVQGQLKKEEERGPLKNLPQLPTMRPVLPPIKLSNHSVSVQDKPYATAQDVAALPSSSLVPLPLPPPQSMPSLAT